MKLLQTLAKVLPVIILFTVVPVLSGCGGGSTTGLSPGSKALDFELYDLDGNTHKLSEYRGQPVLLNFWATWCGPCRGEMPHLEEIYREWESDNLVFFAVNVGESSSDVKSFLDYYGFTMPVLLDRARTASGKYGISGIPTTYFIDKDGIIQDRVVGAFPDVESIEKYVKKLYD